MSRRKKQTIIIRGGRVLDAAAHAAPRKDILVAGDAIVEMGRPGLAAPDDARPVDARGKLLHPGLVNGHTHGHGGLGRAMGDRWTLELLLAAGIWTTGHRNLEDKYLSTLIGAVEMVMKGCTACYDLTYEFPTATPEGLSAVAKAYADVGMRAVVTPMVADRSFYEAIPGLMEALPSPLAKEVEKQRLAPYRTTLSNIRKALHGWSHDRDYVRPAVGPTIPLHCSDRFMKGCAKLARDYGVGLHSHVSESKVQVISGYRRYGTSLVEHLESIGLLGPEFVAAHGVWLDDEDMARLAEHGASVAHNPGSNLRLGNGLADTRGMLERGVNLAIGTDAATCSDNLNMYESMRLASMVSKAQGPDQRRWLSTEEVVEAATAGSAQALGFERIGRLEAGHKADIVFLDIDHINWIPFNDATNQLVHVENGGAVESVMIGGRFVVEGGRPTGVDLRELARKAERAQARLRKLNRPNLALFRRLEKVVGTFCPGLARTPHHIHRYGANPLG